MLGGLGPRTFKSLLRRTQPSGEWQRTAGEQPVADPAALARTKAAHRRAYQARRRRAARRSRLLIAIACTGSAILATVVWLLVHG